MEDTKAFDLVREMMEKKAKNNELKKLSEVENVDEEILKNNPVTDEDIEETESVDDYDYDKEVVENTITPVNEKKKAEEIDISDIKIITAKAIERNKLLKEALYGKTSSIEITASQSGYSCKLSPLTNKDSFNILNSESTNFENTKTTYKTIYDKITEFSCGQMDFKTWLQKTSVGDLETFYYGLYCATFIDEGSFRFTCPECHEETQLKIKNKSLRKLYDFDEMKQLTDRIVKEAINLKAVDELSLVSKSAHIRVSKSKFIFEIKIPTLFDMLELYRTMDDKVLKKHNDTDINTLICTSGILIPDNNGGYVADNERMDILNVIDSLHINDAAELRESILDILEKNHVSYAIQSVKCGKCGKEINDIPLDLKSILFTQIYENR